MKRILILFATLFLALQLNAQDVALLNSIKAANSKVKSFEADLVNTMVKPKRTTSQEGKLYFVKPYKFTAQFTTGKYMIVNEQQLKTNIGLFSGTYQLKGGKTARSLSNIFLYGFQGKIQQLADENGYSLATETKDGYHIITGTIKKKKLIGIGYKQVIFKYHTDSLLLKEIILCDYSGDVDTYTISNVKYDINVDPNRFVF